MNNRTFMTLRTFLLTSIFVATSLFLQGCGGAGGSSKAPDVSLTFNDDPSIFFLFESKKDTDNEGRDTYYSFVGETIAFPRHFFSNKDHTSLDVSKSYWTDSSDTTIQDNNDSLTVTDSHKPLVKACMIPKLSNGKTNSVFCVESEVRDLPGLAKKLKVVSASIDNDHFRAGIQLTELESNDIRATEKTVWQYRWFDKDGNTLKKSGDAITGYKLNYVDIAEDIKVIKNCVFEIATQQCVKESGLVDVPSNNVPVVTILDITGEYKQGGKINPQSRTSYNYTQPAAPFIYEWSVDGVTLSAGEKVASELVFKGGEYFKKDITVCMQRAYKNFTGSGSELTKKVCKTKQFNESDVQVTASYNYGNNLFAQGAPLVFSGKFNGVDAVDFSTFKLTYQGRLLMQGKDYTLTTTFGLNDFTFKILSQYVKPTTEYGPIMRLQCEFTYHNELYSCLGGSNASAEVSLHATGGLGELPSSVIGTIAEKNRISFLQCEPGDSLTWWLKDKGADSYIQTGNEEIIQAGDLCYGNAADGSFYLNESWAGKSLKLIVKRARNGLADDRIQVLNIDLGEISK